MEQIEIENEINNAIKYYKKGQSAIQIRRHIIIRGVSEEYASKITKEALFRFLHQNANIKIIRGLFWFIGGIIASIILFQIAFKYYYLPIFGSAFGFFKVLSGISHKRSANATLNNKSI
jgi:hypothetical protein